MMKIINHNKSQNLTVFWLFSISTFFLQKSIHFNFEMSLCIWSSFSTCNLFWNWSESEAKENNEDGYFFVWLGGFFKFSKLSFYGHLFINFFLLSSSFFSLLWSKVFIIFFIPFFNFLYSFPFNFFHSFIVSLILIFILISFSFHSFSFSSFSWFFSFLSLMTVVSNIL